MPIESPLRGDLLEGGSRNNGMPPEGFADPVTSDGTGFYSNIPVSELINPSGGKNNEWGDSHKNEPTLDRIPATRGGLGKVGLAMRLNARSWNDS